MASCSSAGVDEDQLGEGDVVQKPSKIPKTSIWDTTDEESIQSQLIMSVLYNGGCLGLSYYDTESGQLCIMLDVAETKDYEILKRVIMQVEPSVILTSSKQDENMQQILKDCSSPEGDTGSIFAFSISVEVLPSVEFKYETAHRRIMSYSWPGVQGAGTGEGRAEGIEKEREVRISSIIPMDSSNMVRSTGALLKYLDKKRIGIELEDIGTHVPILSVKRFTLDDLLLMDETAFSSLRIFYRENHPSVYKGSSGSKEGLSLFGIANHTRSSLGHKLLKLWFLRPLKDIGTLSKRLDAIEYLSLIKNNETVASLTDCLKNIKNIPRILVRMSQSHLSITDWQSLYKTTFNAINICELCSTLPQNIYIFKKIKGVLSDGLYQIASLITKVVDFEESVAQNRFVVKYGVNSDLDEKKHTFDGLTDLMTKVAATELAGLDPEVKECQVIYVPQIGFLLRFEKVSWMKQEPDFHIKDMTFAFLSEGHVHYRTKATIELDDLLGDTQWDIHDAETAMMHRLQSVLMEHSGALISVIECTTELDCLVSMSKLAKEHNFVKPELTEDNVIYIKNGRHPLQELCVNTFVPNDTVSDSAHGTMKILTGANASGKSVYLTQVGLIVYLAHIGSFVPAEAAKIGIMDGIFTRVQTRESVSIAQSTFLIDINQVSTAVQCGTHRSLILLDEFGKGTATVDGLALLAAVLRHWLKKEEECPHILVSTHFHSLLDQKLLPDSELIEYLTMDTINDKGELVFLYQLVPGKSDTSHACHIAATVGLPPEIIERAQKVSQQIRCNEPVTQINDANTEAKTKVCIDIVNRFMELDLEKDDVVGFLQDYVLPTAKDII
ncbi:PREDICTED: mutS protein homolog 5 [Amphimedon queenslandica]|uniref:MutS protein homolog 5 n=1 Tax=Amphimedon queenslandica TaxID=400682 RepID=A0AAN0IPD0_AMPQE|nr:PREDICTED: mutS protein homolog 5 [Amphimedon queenslandica]|eukprot:XP_011405401.2 PREDICTED: mutS protein homolog 5 [Amphimedon queenslandica]